MNRASSLAVALACTALTGAFSLNACAQEKPSPLADWIVGTNYTLLETPQPTMVEKGKVEVREFFWYGCGHCYALDPVLEAWKTSKPPYVEFVRMPVMWGPAHKQHAILYYVLQELGRADLHPKVFDAIHRDGKMLASPNEADARALQLEFFKEHGVTEADFNKAYDSATVAANVERARSATSRFAVASVPLIYVNGKYVTSVSEAGTNERLLTLINDLAASEKGR